MSEVDQHAVSVNRGVCIGGRPTTWKADVEENVSLGKVDRFCRVTPVLIGTNKKPPSAWGQKPSGPSMRGKGRYLFVNFAASTNVTNVDNICGEGGYCQGLGRARPHSCRVCSSTSRRRQTFFRVTRRNHRRWVTAVLSFFLGSLEMELSQIDLYLPLVVTGISSKCKD